MPIPEADPFVPLAIVDVDPETGVFFVREQESPEAMPHRRPVNPGTFIDGEWVRNDLDGEPDEVKAAAVELWTGDRVAEFQKRNPWIEVTAPPPRTIADIRADMERLQAEMVAQLDQLEAADKGGQTAG